MRPWWLFEKASVPRDEVGRSWSSESSAFLGPVSNMENMIQFIPSAERTPGVGKGVGTSELRNVKEGRWTGPGDFKGLGCTW